MPGAVLRSGGRISGPTQLGRVCFGPSHFVPACPFVPASGGPFLGSPPAALDVPAHQQAARRRQLASRKGRNRIGVAGTPLFDVTFWV